MGMSNTWATIPGFLGPAVFGWLTHKHVTEIFLIYYQSFNIRLLVYVFETSFATYTNHIQLCLWEQTSGVI
jgi:hypothetical protein